MDIITLSFILYSLQCVYSFDLYDTGFNYLTKQLLEDVSKFGVIISAEARSIQQPIDHFGENSQTWQMRYFESLDYFQNNGPIYIFIGGEGEANPLFLSGGEINQLAQETNGAMYMTEHRYYGKSKPFDDINTENLKWLSSKQALADVANLIKNIKSDSKFQSSKVVVIGGSYAGSLAAWMKLKYPELVDAAIASSGPVLAKKDFSDYLQKVNDDYERYGTPDCLSNIKAKFQKFQEMLKTSEGIQQLKQEQNICDEVDMSDRKNQFVFFMINISPFMQQSQYGGPDKIRDHCSNLHMEKLSQKLPWNIKNCNDISFQGFINFMKRSDNYHSWFYQQCTEFGYFQTTSSRSQPFGDAVSKDMYIEICKNLFGPEFDEDKVDNAVQTTNSAYGGQRPDVKQVVFVNGDVDPWSTLSVLQDLSDEAPAIVVPKGTHCADIVIRPDSSEELKGAVERIKQYIKKWIGVGNIPV
ncbi:unnamed protein product [Colias eurytheme]|nr:unnamed protein product [Colias eurytheme]